MNVPLTERLALVIIARYGCETFTTGIGSCLRPGSGRELLGCYGSEQACAPCIAHAALTGDES